MAQRSVYVRMQAADVEALARLALAQCRRPSDQAAWLLREALKQATHGTQAAETPDRQPVEAGAAH